MEFASATWLDTPSIEDGYQQSSAKTKVLAILAALSNKDSLEIFTLALDGLDATTEILKQGHFTKKRYYVRLKELVDLGLLHKLSGKYVHTLLGKKVYEDSVKTLEEAVLSYTLPVDQIDNPAAQSKVYNS